MKLKRMDYVMSGIVALCLAGGMAGTVAIPAEAATATACTSRTTHSHTVSSRGSVSDRWTTKVTCGKDYTEAEHGWSRSYTGASSTFRLAKVMRFPCWTEHEVRRSVSKTGIAHSTVTDSRGC
jgi:hypothetical protein